MSIKTAVIVGLLFPTIVFSGAVNCQNLTVTLTGLLSDKGQLVVSVYNTKKHWLSDKTSEIFAQQVIPLKDQVSDNTIQFTLELPEGKYALYLYQDKDKNNELKSNWIGIPKEPVGTSNNAKGSFGPPKYQDALFEITEQQAAIQIINLANLD